MEKKVQISITQTDFRKKAPILSMKMKLSVYTKKILHLN